MSQKYNRSERDIIEDFKLYAKNHSCSFAEYTSFDVAQKDCRTNFVIQWRGRFVNYIRVNRSKFAPPYGIKYLRQIKYMDVELLSDDYSWITEIASVRELSLHVHSEYDPEKVLFPLSLSKLTIFYDSDVKMCILPSSLRNLRNSLRWLTVKNFSSAYICLPEWMHEFTRLQRLNLSGCKVDSIPSGIIHLGLPFYVDEIPSERDYGIVLYDVTLHKGDLTLFSYPNEVIESYYSGEKGLVRECKVIFLGDGAAGKSSLIERILYNRFNYESPPTEGVAMSKWPTTVQGIPYTLRILDFGGQEIMHAMHRCFLTSHTVYVVVCESRDDTEIDHVAVRWLETVKAFAPGCPVILALNKVDLNQNVSVNEKILKRRNPQLQYIIKTSAKQDNGIDELINAIQAAVPGCINSIEANANMLNIKRELEEMRKDYISAKEYQDICSSHNVFDPHMQRYLLDYFKDLGVAYFYETSQLNTILESLRVLNPAWLTNGIYRLIIRAPENGFLEHSIIRNTLGKRNPMDIAPDKLYSSEETEFILYVMRMFEISHNIQTGIEMIPMKMPKTPPDSIDSFQKSTALHLRWESTYIPNNLIHRLMIRKVLELDMSCVWRTGGIFRGEGYVVLAEMGDDSSLDIYVHADYDSRVYMEDYRIVVRRILREINIDASEVIFYRKGDIEGRVPYSYAEVIDQYHMGNRFVYIPELRENILLWQLLQETYLHPENEISGSPTINIGAIHGNASFSEGDNNRISN